MFRRFTAPSPLDSSDNRTRQEKALALFRLHPSEISALLELAWELRIYDSNVELGRPNRRSDISQLPDYLLSFFPFTEDNRNLFATPGGSVGERLELEGSVLWDHLIYAYLIENTRIFEIFRRIIFEYRHGEKLGVPLASAQHWLRNTEELFLRDPAPFTIYSISSYIRPDSGATRRNAYYRMFGMDLNHGIDDGKDYPYIKPEASNREFVNTLEEFFREVWQGIENQNNTSGSNPQDDAAISDLATRLHDMLLARRTNGNISREEFWIVSMMSWFHLTVEFNSPIIASVRAEAFSEEERLKKVAERVKLPSHGKSYYFFRLASPMSWLLTQIEAGFYNNEAAVSALYTSGSPVETVMRGLIHNWSQATGRNMKVKTRPVSVQN